MNLGRKSRCPTGGPDARIGPASRARRHPADLVRCRRRRFLRAIRRVASVRTARSRRVGRARRRCVALRSCRSRSFSRSGSGSGPTSSGIRPRVARQRHRTTSPPTAATDCRCRTSRLSCWQSGCYAIFCRTLAVASACRWPMPMRSRAPSGAGCCVGRCTAGLPPCCRAKIGRGRSARSARCRAARRSRRRPCGSCPMSEC